MSLRYEQNKKNIEKQGNLNNNNIIHITVNRVYRKQNIGNNRENVDNVYIFCKIISHDNQLFVGTVEYLGTHTFGTK